MGLNYISLALASLFWIPLPGPVLSASCFCYHNTPGSPPRHSNSHAVTQLLVTLVIFFYFCSKIPNKKHFKENLFWLTVRRDLCCPHNECMANTGRRQLITLHQLSESMENSKVCSQELTYISKFAPPRDSTAFPNSPTSENQVFKCISLCRASRSNHNPFLQTLTTNNRILSY